MDQDQRGWKIKICATSAKTSSTGVLTMKENWIGFPQSKHIQKCIIAWTQNLYLVENDFIVRKSSEQVLFHNNETSNPSLFCIRKGRHISTISIFKCSSHSRFSPTIWTAHTKSIQQKSCTMLLSIVLCSGCKGCISSNMDNLAG